MVIEKGTHKSKGRALPVVPNKRAEREDAELLQRAQKLLSQKRYDDAREILEDLTNPPTTALRANASLLFAGVELMQGRAKQALDILSRTPTGKDWKVDEGYLHMIAASAHRQLRDVEKALHHANASVQRGPTSGRLLTLADAQKHAGKLADAIETLDKVLDLEPDHPVALASLAGYQVLAGFVEEAKETFSRFLEVAPDDADTARNTAFFHAVMRDKKAVLRSLKSALDADLDLTKAYIEDEVEFDRWRSDPEFQALTAE